MRNNTRVGDIFRIVASPDWCVQLVAIDRVNMNSDVVVVFVDKPGEIMQPAFYTHTTVVAGVNQGLWTKEGNADIKTELSGLMFKNYVNLDEEDVAFAKEMGLSEPHESHWLVWTPQDESMRTVSLVEGKSIKAEPGGVYPPIDVVYRVQNSVSEFKSDWPK